MKKILVTGAGGYIGRHVVASLLDKGAHVTACDLNLQGIDPRATGISLDIFSGGDDLYNRLGAPDACLHMAWKDGFVHDSDAHMECLSMHYAFIRDMLRQGLGQIAVMGSMHEVGYYEGAVDENTPCRPVTMYGIAKDALRRSLQVLTRGKGVTLQWLRAFYIYGDDKRNNSIFAKLAVAEENGQGLFPFTSGKNKYDFVDVDTLAHMLAACVLQEKVDGVINCCTGEPVSLADQVEGFIKEHGYKIRLQYGVFPDRPYDSPAIWGDSTKIHEIMKGW